jgi:ubiquitin C-terminal hydrolase
MRYSSSDQGGALPPAAGPESGGVLYELVAVVVHLGSTGGGHFVTFRRLAEAEGEGKKGKEAGEEDAGSEGANSRWFYCSDRDVRPSSLEEALGQRAYLLFYERLTS